MLSAGKCYNCNIDYSRKYTKIIQNCNSDFGSRPDFLVEGKKE